MILYIVNIFLSAFLVFQVQPMIARYILPWFGGTPAVWSTVQLFFQVVLTGGYAYASWLIRGVPVQRQRRVHSFFLGLSVLVMLSLSLLWPSPITPAVTWRPQNVDFPIGRIFLLLLASVGLPYFLLSTNSPLMQVWFGRAYRGKSPYWLYALSNVGSLFGLLAYPVLIEPQLTLREQGWFWSVGYFLFVILTGYGAWRSGHDQVDAEKDSQQESHPDANLPVPLARQMLWILLSGTASALLLAVTSQMTQEVAVIPFLWVLPLAMYLLSFVFAFSGDGAYSRPLFTFLFSLASCGFVYLVLHPQADLFWQIGLYAFFVFIGAMCAHGELYRLRPHASRLPRFYLMVSIGGALGGVSVNLIAPYVFNGYLELYICWVLLAVLLAVLTFYNRTSLGQRLRFFHDVWVGAVAVAVLLFSSYVIIYMSENEIFQGRNFYGMVRVRDNEDVYFMVHGITTHGFQYKEPEKRMIPTGYYWHDSGVGLFIRNHPKYNEQSMRIGVLGLGTGTIATYAQPGDVYRFYEINPLVRDLAEGKGGYFSFLQDTSAKVDVVMGDARISLEYEDPQNYDVLVLDAFSSDSIPVHLITREAFSLYLKHLAPDGVIAVHISNRYMDLRPVIWQMGQEFGLRTVAISTPASSEHPEAFSSVWMGLSRDPSVFDALEIASVADPMDGFSSSIRLWTDDFSNLFQVLR